MANKRRPLSFPELEHRGRKAILRTAEEVAAEERMLEIQNTSIPASQHLGMTEGQPAGIPEIQNAGHRASYIKATYRLSPQAIDAIEDAKRLLRRQHKIKASLEEIAEQAILSAYQDLTTNQHDSFLVNQLSSKPASRRYGKNS